jgi:hypothetical protein
MAKIKGQTVTIFLKKPKKRRPGVHAKTKQSSHKHGKHYDKPYVGQGK